jgi:protein-tyrosine phosphatase
VKRILFLCTGNYYRSRFAEIFFNWLAERDSLPWRAESRGLALHDCNVGPISRHASDRLRQLGIEDESVRRFPESLTADDLAAANLIVAVKDAEHRPMLATAHPKWLERVEFWEVHDLDCAPPEAALPVLEAEIRRLLARLSRAAA